MVQECSRLQQQAMALEEEHKGHIAEVVSDVEAMRKAMTDQSADLERTAQRAKQKHDEELSVHKARLATVTGETFLYNERFIGKIQFPFKYKRLMKLLELP